MLVRSMKRQIRSHLARLLVRLLQTEEVSVHLQQRFPDYGKIRSDIDNYQTPYRRSESHIRQHRRPIFVTGRFRSGSTLLWNIFRHLPDHTAFYEPFNERRWFDLSARGEHTDGTHKGVTDYWSEYDGLSDLGSFYRENWIRANLYMDEQSFDYPMKRYIETLIWRAPARPVLQFNRADFRLPWLRHNFPEAALVHIYRNPRDQWCSVLRSPLQYPSTSTTAENFPDHFYLRMWYRDLVAHFPFLAHFENRHQYCLFYLLWKLSYCFGKRYADISLGMEDLVANPESEVSRLLQVTGDAGHLDTLDLSFIESSPPRWQDYASEEWYREIEDECESWLGEFFHGGAKT